jgi:hypothetical protein
MAKVQFKSGISIELDQLLAGVVQLETSDLEQLLIQVQYVLAHRESPNLPVLEIELLQKINQTLPEELQERYKNLSTKMRSGIITTDEHQDLLNLIEIVEQNNGDRLKYLIQLSQLRNISLAMLMEQLQIRPPQPVHV